VGGGVRGGMQFGTQSWVTLYGRDVYSPIADNNVIHEPSLMMRFLPPAIQSASSVHSVLRSLLPGILD